MVKEIEVGGDAQKGFAQINEDGNVKNGVGVEMAKCNLVVL